MTIELFVILLLADSVLVSLATEALKLIFDEHNIKYYSNTLVGILSAVVTVIITIVYALYTNAVFDHQLIAMIIGLFFLSWLCAMLGYDKVLQSLKQITDAVPISSEDETDDQAAS